MQDLRNAVEKFKAKHPENESDDIINAESTAASVNILMICG